VLGNSSKVLVDQKSGSLLYLPLDNLIQQSGPASAASPEVPAAAPRPPAPDPALEASRSRDALRNRDSR